MSGISVMLFIVFVMFVIQALGGVWQMKNYRKAIHRVHKFGNVGFGQKKGGLTVGYIVMIACDEKGIITGGEIMKGISFLAKFQPWTTFLGKDVIGVSIYDYLDQLRSYDKRKRKRYKGYINALEALEQRFQNQEISVELLENT